MEVEVQFQAFLTSAWYKGFSKTRVNTLLYLELYFDSYGSVTEGMHQNSMSSPLTFKHLCHRGKKLVSSVCSQEVTLLQVDVYRKLLASHILKGGHCAQDRDCTESVLGAPYNSVVSSCKSGWHYGDQWLPIFLFPLRRSWLKSDLQETPA